MVNDYQNGQTAPKSGGVEYMEGYLKREKSLTTGNPWKSFTPLRPSSFIWASAICLTPLGDKNRESSSEFISNEFVNCGETLLTELKNIVYTHTRTHTHTSQMSLNNESLELENSEPGVGTCVFIPSQHLRG